jgi:transcriptional regulator with XRE-family HTH domain
VSDFIVRLRRLRKEKGLSQRNLACLAGMSERYIANLERGDFALGRLGAIKLAEALGVSESELRGAK